MNKRIAQIGFTIVELSVALIIISLLSALVLAGSLLIENSKLNKIIADFTALNKSYQTFDLTYNAYPGDFGKAYSIWQSNCAVSAAACNGNGDGKIQSYLAGVTSSINDDEVRKVWLHLELSGLSNFAIFGNSFPTTWSSTYSVDSSIPSSPIKGAGYVILYGNDKLRTQNEPEPVGGIFSPSSSSIIYLGRPSDGYLVANSALKPMQAMGIDNKIDDGNFATGNGADSGIFRSFDGLDSGAGNCATTAIYNLLSKNSSCVVGFEIR